VHVDAVLVEGDAQSIHDKLNNYERFDTEERYALLDSGT
jgi:hypothetical protein